MKTFGVRIEFGNGSENLIKGELTNHDKDGHEYMSVVTEGLFQHVDPMIRAK